MASDLVKFRELLVQKIDTGYQIPVMVLKDNNELGQAFARIALSEKSQEGETEGQKAGRYLDEICASLNENDNSGVVPLLNDAIALFTTKIKAAWDNITAIRDMGRELASEMDKITNDQLNNSEFVSKHRNYSNLVEDFPVFTWEGTKTMGSMSHVIARVNGLMTNDGSEPSEEINRNLYNIIISDMTKFDQLESVTVNEESRQAAIDLFKQICQNAPAGNIETAVDLITGINKTIVVSDILSKLTQMSYAQVHMVDTIKVFDEAITNLYPIMELITSDQVNPFPANSETIKANAKKLITILELAAYYEYMVRMYSLNESVLLQGGLINGDLEEEFKKAGGTLQMLGEFVRFMYKDDVSQIPVTGIRISGIVDSAANVHDSVTKDIANVASRVAMATSNARTAAYRIVMRNHISKHVQRTNEGADVNDVSCKVEELMVKVVVPLCDNIRQYDVNFMDVAMNAIVKVQFPGTFTEHMFAELGAAYLAATEQGGNITAADIAQADVAVISKLVCTYLVDNVVEFVKTEPASV